MLGDGTKQSEPFPEKRQEEQIDLFSRGFAARSRGLSVVVVVRPVFLLSSVCSTFSSSFLLGYLLDLSPLFALLRGFFTSHHVLLNSKVLLVVLEMSRDASGKSAPSITVTGAQPQAGGTSVPAPISSALLSPRPIVPKQSSLTLSEQLQWVKTGTLEKETAFVLVNNVGCVLPRSRSIVFGDRCYVSMSSRFFFWFLK